VIIVVKFDKEDKPPQPPVESVSRVSDRILLIILWDNCKRHFVRWLKTGKRPTAEDDLNKFEAKLKEVMDF